MTDVYITSAFCKDNRGGNKAGVVLDSSHLDTSDKMKLAERLGFSETAFLSQSAKADVKLEYFTPTEEVPLCGHATIAAFVTLNCLGLLHKNDYLIETNAGLLHINVADDGLVFMEQNPPVFYDVLQKAELRHCFDTDCISTKFPAQIVSTGLKDILIPISSPEHLRELNPDLQAIANISRTKNVIGIHAFSLVNDGECTAVCRNFAPICGIDEESATGTSNCALACYLFVNGRRQSRYIFEQGHNLHSISRIYVSLKTQGPHITNVCVGGYGYFLEKRSVL